MQYDLAASEADGQSALAARFRKLMAGSKISLATTTSAFAPRPPALDTISLAVMQAVNALLMPLAATSPDFCSTVQFLSMMDQVTGQLVKAGIEVNWNFVQLLSSEFDVNDLTHAIAHSIME